MPSGSLMASVRMTYPFGILHDLLWSAFGDGLFGAAVDGLAGSRLEFRWDVGLYRLGVAVVGQGEHVLAEGDTHAMTTTQLIVDPNFHVGANSRCSSLRPRRIYV